METIENTVIKSYAERCKGMYPGYAPDGYEKLAAELNRLGSIRDAKHDALRTSIKTHGALTQQAILAQGEYDDAEKAFSELEKAITSGAAFTDQGIEYTHHFATPPEFSVVDYCGRFFVDKNRLGFSAENYNDTEAAQTVAEGETAEVRDLMDYMSRTETGTEDAIIFEDILEVSEFIYNDDIDTVREALKSVYNKHRINAENRKIFAKILAVKTPVTIDPMVVQDAINAHLVGSNAKRGAEIWTNATGFAALDQVDSHSGISLITRNGNGDFVYRNKYIVREFSNENMPNNAEGKAPVIIGDFKNIVRMAVVRTTTLEKHDLWRCTKMYRRIDKEIPVLTTTENNACIVGYIGA